MVYSLFDSLGSDHYISQKLFPDLMDIPEAHRSIALQWAASQCASHIMICSIRQVLAWSLLVFCVIIMPITSQLPSAVHNTYVAIVFPVVAIACAAYGIKCEIRDVRSMLRLQCRRLSINKCLCCGYVNDRQSRICTECGVSLDARETSRRSMSMIPQSRSLPLIGQFDNVDTALNALGAAFNRHPIIARGRGRVALAIAAAAVISTVLVAEFVLTDSQGAPLMPQWAFQLTAVTISVCCAMAWRIHYIGIINKELGSLLEGQKVL